MYIYIHTYAHTHKYLLSVISWIVFRWSPATFAKVKPSLPTRRTNFSRCCVHPAAQVLAVQPKKRKRRRKKVQSDDITRRQCAKQQAALHHFHSRIKRTSAGTWLCLKIRHGTSLKIRHPRVNQSCSSLFTSDKCPANWASPLVI